MIPKVSSWKREAVSNLAVQVEKGGVLAVIDVHGVPAGAMLGMRKSLSESMQIQVAKKQLMRRAWEESGRNLEDLESLFTGAVQPALVQSSNMTSFEIFQELKKTEAGRAAKPGDVAPYDIVVEKQDTGMPPGPIVGELNTVNIPAKIMKGSVHISKQTVVLRKGEVFDGDLGMLLGKIGIEPIVTGLRLCGTFEDGVVFDPETLDIDYDAFRSELVNAVASTYNLACNIAWFTDLTMPALLSKASSEAFAVALEAGITNSETTPVFIARAHAGAIGVAGSLEDSALDDELREQLGAAASAAEAAPADQEAEAAPADAAEAEEEDEEEAEFGGLGDLFG